jgi:hypothetical protein
MFKQAVFTDIFTKDSAFKYACHLCGPRKYPHDLQVGDHSLHVNLPVLPSPVLVLTASLRVACRQQIITGCKYEQIETPWFAR